MIGALGRLWRGRNGVIAPAMLLVLIGWSQGAQASAALCRSLEAQLSSLPTRTDTGRAASYDRAIAKQQDEIAAVRAQSRSLGCGFAIFPGRAAQCGSLAATIDRMEVNLLKLRQSHSRLSGGQDNRRERARILASIEVNGCRSRPAQVEQVTTGRSVITITPGGGLPFGGQYRTMCVRSCDGYFFPVENASSPQEFQRDEQRCRSLCPGAEVELYYQRQEEESGQMMSVASGTAYAQQPFAFRFRQTDYRRPESCGCNAPRGFSIIGGEGSEPGQEASPAVEASLPMPRPRPDPALDPEAHADKAGGLDRAAIERLLPPPAAAAPSPPESGERRVRVVGPTFLPDQQEAAVPQAPAPQAGP